MTKHIRFMVVLGAASCLLGCSGTIPVVYTPQNFARFQGETDIGKFIYEPSMPKAVSSEPATLGSPPSSSQPRPGSSKGESQIAPNQIRNTAIGSIYVAVNISDLVQRATALELEKTGIVLTDKCPTAVSGDVLYFKADDLGYSVDWTYAVRYKITRKSDATVLLNKVYAADPKKTGKFGQAADYAPSVNEMILSAYDKFIRDEDVRKLLALKVEDQKSASPVPGA
jgi:hypothetical protein